MVLLEIYFSIKTARRIRRAVFIEKYISNNTMTVSKDFYFFFYIFNKLLNF